MTVVSLPMSMGTSHGSNPFTATYTHPILYIGSSYCSLKNEVKDWLITNCTGKWKFAIFNHEYGIQFEYDEDAMLFALRWL